MLAVAAGQGEEEAPRVDEDSLRSKCADDPTWMRLLFTSEEPQSFEGAEGAAARGEEAACAAAEARAEASRDASGASQERLAALVHMHQPALTVCLGLAGGRSALSLERIGININDARAICDLIQDHLA